MQSSPLFTRLLARFNAATASLPWRKRSVACPPFSQVLSFNAATALQPWRKQGEREDYNLSKGRATVVVRLNLLRCGDFRHARRSRKRRGAVKVADGWLDGGQICHEQRR